MLLETPRRLPPRSAFGERRIVDLSAYDDLFGAIVMGSSEVFWRNQTGGVACHHPSEEGIFIPLPRNILPMANYDRFRGLHNGLYRAASVWEWLSSFDLENIFAPSAHVEGTNVLDEAWIHVIVRDPQPALAFQPFAGYGAIITYTNSD